MLKSLGLKMHFFLYTTVLTLEAINVAKRVLFKSAYFRSNSWLEFLRFFVILLEINDNSAVLDMIF